MLKKYYPYAYAESVFSIDYERLFAKGYRGLIFDIDNTLVHHGEDSTPEVDSFFRRIQALGFKTLLLSNNSEKRILRFLENIDSMYIAEANKPDVGGYYEALRRLDLQKEQVVCIGDQVFTDIRGANKSGIPSILVKYMRYPDEKKIGIHRNLEKIILKFYFRNHSCHNRLGDICIGGVKQ